MTQHKFTTVIHTFKSAEAGIMVNGYLIETSDHVVAVDSALIESASRELRKQFDSLGKPLAFVLVTHGHPDHYNGLTQLTAGMNVDIISTPQTDRVIRESDSSRKDNGALFSGRNGPRREPFRTEPLRMDNPFPSMG